MRDAARAVDRWIERGPIVADTYGEPLRYLIERPLAWVKINRTEFDTLFDETERSEPVVNRLRLAASDVAPRLDRNRWTETGLVRRTRRRSCQPSRRHK